MALLETILLNVGGTLVSKVIARKFGDEFGELAGTAIEALAEAFGVAPNETAIGEAISAAPKAEAAKKVGEIEAATAAAVLARVELVKAENAGLVILNEQLVAERKEPWFAWAWRPAWMWLLGAFWSWELIGLHVLNAVFKIALPVSDLWVVFQLTVLIAGLYMGGHTVKDFIEKKWGGETVK